MSGMNGVLIKKERNKQTNKTAITSKPANQQTMATTICGNYLSSGGWASVRSRTENKCKQFGLQ